MFKNVLNIQLKTSIDIFNIKKCCHIAEKTLSYLKQFISPGISTSKLDAIATEYILDHKAQPALKGYKGFPCAICASVNNIAAHGIPSDIILKTGDIITVDITVALDGWYGDAAWTYLVGDCDIRIQKLLKAAWQSSLAGIFAVKAGRSIGDIGYYVMKTANRSGCAVIEEFGGHGIGRAMHEDPIIPHIGKKGSGIQIVPGMVFTIEPILTFGKSDILFLDDGWTIAMKDGSCTAQFEHTVAVFKDRIEILTFSEKFIKNYIDTPPYF